MKKKLDRDAGNGTLHPLVRDDNRKAWMWELSVRAVNVLTNAGCDWSSIETAKKFVSNAIKLGTAEMWRNCGCFTVNELSVWCGTEIDYGPRAAQAIVYLENRGFKVIFPNIPMDTIDKVDGIEGSGV